MTGRYSKITKQTDAWAETVACGMSVMFKFNWSWKWKKSWAVSKSNWQLWTYENGIRPTWLHL